MGDSLVSILIPTYNGERYLRKALRSALEQSYKEIEVLVGDDASTDSTPDVLAAAAAADPRVRVIRHETNLGAYDNPVRLLQEARGEYVKFLLHDDLLMRDCVRDLVRGMESEEGVTLAFSRRSIIGADGRPVQGGELTPLRDKPGVIDNHELADGVLTNCLNVIGEVTTVLFRRTDVDPESLWDVDGRPLVVLGDLKLSLGLLARGRAFYTPRTLSNFRLHDSQRSRDLRMRSSSTLDWVLLIDWARRQGLLADRQTQKAAFGRSLRVAADVREGLPEDSDAAAPLEAAYLATVALAELEGVLPDGRDEPLSVRAHGGAVLAGLARPLHSPALL